MDVIRNVVIVRVVDAGTFLVREKPGPNSSFDAQKFVQLTADMKSFYEDEAFPRLSSAYHRTGKVYVAKHEGVWKRVRYHYTMTTLSGPKASCDLLDFGVKKVAIPVPFVHEARDEFLCLPFQVLTVKLDGVRPQTLLADEECNMSWYPSDKWDEAANTFVKQLVCDVSEWQIQLVSYTNCPDGADETAALVRLSGIPEHTPAFCLNELLVERQFAIHYDTKAPQQCESLHGEQDKSGTALSVQDMSGTVLGKSQVYPAAPDSYRQCESSGQRSDFSPGHQSQYQLPHESQYHSDRSPTVPPESYKSPTEPVQLQATAGTPIYHSSVESSPTTAARSPICLQSVRSASCVTQSVAASVESSGQRSLTAEFNGSPQGDTQTAATTAAAAASSSITTATVRQALQVANVEMRTPSPGVETPGVTSPRAGGVGVSSPGVSSGVGRGKLLQRLLATTSSKTPSNSVDRPGTCTSPVDRPGLPPTSPVDRPGLPPTSPVDRPGLPPTSPGSRVLQTVSQTSAISDLVQVPSKPASPQVAERIQSKPASPQVAEIQSAKRLFTGRLPKFASQSRGKGPSSSHSRSAAAAAAAADPGGSGDGSRLLCLADPVNQPQVHSSQSQQARSATQHGAAETQHGAADTQLQSDTINVDEQLTAMRREEQNLAPDGVLIDGPTFVKGISELAGLPYRDLIASTKGLDDICRPTLLQMYAWPAVFRGMDMIGVAPSAAPGRTAGGKTLSHLLPLICLLQNKHAYSKLPRYGVGSFMLILCATWRKALHIFDLCSNIIHRKRVDGFGMPLLIHGGNGDTQMKEVQLINGAEILIGTPDCFIRMMHKRVTGLTRMCHLIIEDADILTSDFLPQLTEIMDQYKLVLHDRQDLPVPQQLVMFASHWNEHMRRFSAQYQCQPCVVIASKMEAAYYGRVKQVVTVCANNERFKHILLNLQLRQKKLIIFTSSDAEAKHLFQMFRCSSVSPLVLLHGEMTVDMMNMELEAWKDPGHRKDSPPVLVMSDHVHGLVPIYDATAVIHYTMPLQQHSFACRLWTLRCSFELHDTKDRCADRCADEGVSFVYVSDDGQPPVARRVVRLLQRSGSPVPAKLLKMVESETREQELLSQQPLCHSVKSFGLCPRRATSCKSRHNMFDSLDTPQDTLPTSGTVKVQVKTVQDATCYYVELIEHRGRDGSLTRYNKDREVVLSVNSYYSNKRHRIVPVNIRVGQVYGWHDSQNLYYRVKVRHITQDPCDLRPRSVVVDAIDNGFRKEVEWNELYALPGKYADKPHLAVQVFICRVKPVDGDVEWTDVANSFIAGKIESEELEGEIVLALGSTLWLDPFVRREFLSDLGETIENFSVRALLLNGNFAVDNVSHLELLYEACELTQLKLPTSKTSQERTNYGYTVAGRRVTTQTVRLPTDTNPLSVTVTCVESPDLFYVQLDSNKQIVEQIQHDVNQYVAMNYHAKIQQPKDGLLVLARFDFDSRWYRGKLIVDCRHSAGDVATATDTATTTTTTLAANNSDNSDTVVTVFFVDYGNTEQISFNDVVPMPYAVRREPFQAVECSLVNTEFIDNFTWSEASLDAFESLVLDRQLSAQIVRSSTARVTGSTHYALELCNEMSEYTFNVANYLIACGHARLSTTVLHSTFMNQELHEPKELKQLATVCYKVLFETLLDRELSDVLQQLETVIQQIVDSGACRKNVVKVLSKTLMYCWQPAVVHTVTLALQRLVVDNTFHCAELGCTEDVDNNTQPLTHWDTFCHMLQTTMDVAVVEDLLSFLKVSVDCVYCSCLFAERGGLRILSQRLNDSMVFNYDMLNDSMVVIEHIVSSLTANAKTDLTVVSSCLETGFKSCVLCAFSLSQRNISDNVTASCYKILSTLLANSSEHFNTVSLVGAAGLEQFSLFLETLPQCDPSLCGGIELLKLFVVHELMTKEVLTKANVYQALSRLMSRDDVRSDVSMYKQCSDIQSRLTRLLPQKLMRKLMGSSDKRQPITDKHRSQTVNNKPVNVADNDTVRESKHPTIHWAQSRHSLLLTVDVKDVRLTDLHIETTDNSITFRTAVMCIEYTFNLQLYATVTFHHVRVVPSCVFIGIHKQSASLWPCLLHTTRRPPVYVQPDIEHTTLSSSDDDNSDIDEPLTLVTRSARQSTGAPWTTATPNTVCDYVPEAELSRSSSSQSGDSDSESDIELHFDATLRQDKEFGYHVVS